MKIFCLTLTFLLLFTSFVFSEDDEIDIKITVTITPQRIIAGNPFNLNILVDYPNPDDVSVIMPPFSGTLILDRYIRSPRVFSDGTTQSSFDFRLIANETGRIVIGHLPVLTPLGIFETETIILDIRSETEERTASSRLTWEGAPSQITAGDRVILMLRVNAARLESVMNLPPPSFFMPEVPKGVILSNSSISAQEKDEGIVLKLMLIPLSAGNFNLPARTLFQEIPQLRQRIRYDIPTLNIRVTERSR